jgi:bifunctional DNase/RNase
MRGVIMAIPVVLHSVRKNMTTNDPVVFLREADADRYVLIHIGELEARAINLKLRGETTDRPMTHDVWATTLEQLGGALTAVHITKLEDEVFYQVQQGTQTLEVDVRPSDAIALAIRTGAPLFATDAVLDRAGLRMLSDVTQDQSDAGGATA